MLQPHSKDILMSAWNCSVLSAICQIFGSSFIEE